jgi:hypothetical protein
MSSSIIVGAFQCWYSDWISFLAIAWSAIVEEKVEDAASLLALVALPAPATGMSLVTLEVQSALPDMME